MTGGTCAGGLLFRACLLDCEMATRAGFRSRTRVGCYDSNSEAIPIPQF